jgi:hypothetical protein
VVEAHHHHVRDSLGFGRLLVAQPEDAHGSGSS